MYNSSIDGSIWLCVDHVYIPSFRISVRLWQAQIYQNERRYFCARRVCSPIMKYTNPEVLSTVTYLYSIDPPDIGSVDNGKAYT